MNVNAYNRKHSYNPLRSAGSNRHFNIVKYLLEHNADASVLTPKERFGFKITFNPDTKQYQSTEKGLVKNQK